MPVADTRIWGVHSRLSFGIQRYIFGALLGSVVQVIVKLGPCITDS